MALTWRDVEPKALDEATLEDFWHLSVTGDGLTHSQIRRLIAHIRHLDAASTAARAEEREACARVAEDIGREELTRVGFDVGHDIAAAIRARACTCGDDPRLGCSNCPPERAQSTRTRTR